MAVQVGTVDGLINITPVIKDCFVKAIDSFSNNVIKNNKLGDLSIGDAFQRYTYPVYSGKETEFKLESLKNEVTTKNGNKQSPAYVTYCKKMGLLETDGTDSFELTPLGSALLEGQIELHEYAMLYMSKQGIFKDGTYKGNLLEHIANIFKVSPSITPDELLQSIATKYGDSNFQKTRSDIILGALCAAKILSKVNNVYVLAGIAQAQVLNIFAMNGKNIRPAILDTDQAYADYIGTFKYGIYDFLNEKNLSSFAYLYPNLITHLQENYTPGSPSLPLQQIFYGAPGTGKSHETNRVTREYRDTIRTTFHPDSDYSTFVGAYKPTTTREFVYGLNGGNTIAFIDPNTNKPLETSKIEYKFVKQAFLKAYIRAWQKMGAADVTTNPLQPSATPAKPLTFTKGLATYTILTMDDSCVSFKKEEPFGKSPVKNTWQKLWSSGSFEIPNVPRSGATFQEAVSQWIYDLKGAATTINDFDDGWKQLISRLKAGEEIQVQRDGGTQKYVLSYDGNDDSVKKTSEDKAYKNAIEKAYNGDTSQNASAKGIAEILHSYSSDFDKAWEQLKTVLLNGGQQTTNPTETIAIQPQFLIIEEINRGNCAQIFGDIFQLLDRKGGYSEYPIEADEDIKKALLEDDPADGLSFGGEGLKLSDGIIDELNEVFNESSDDIVSKICMGDVLVLPKNLYIWATMNTSDQSLFPIDSAFKRRWDWTYMPIKEAKDKNYKIVLSGSNIEYKWWDFISAINDVINVVTSSEDKKLGYFFCKPCDDKNITASQFVNKVIFYLWNDVLKDYEMPKEFEYGETKKKEDSSKSNHMSFNDFYTDQEKCIRQLMENLGVKPIAEVVKTELTTDDASTAATSEPATDDATASTATSATDSTTEQSLF